MAKILIVEDDPMISEIYQRKFESAGFEVLVAVSGKEVLKAVEKDKFDLVLLDMVLPEMSGLEILAELKSGKYDPAMRVIIFSNLSEKSDRDKALEGGADGYIGKTQFSPSELVTEIKRLLNEFGEHNKNEARRNGTAEAGKKEGKKKILFIEDEEFFADMLGKKLEDEGYEVEYAKNGVWGVKEVTEKDFDLIITDMVMPQMGGEEIIKKLKMEDKTKNIPIIALSASMTEDDIKIVKQYGVENYFLKTHLIPSDLARLVGELLKGK